MAEEYLEHSYKGSVWKKHKYIQKIGHIYRYNKKSTEYWKDALDREDDAYGIAQAKGEADFRGEKYGDGVTKDAYDKAMKDRDLYLRRSNEYGNMALNEAEKLFGKTGGKLLNNLISKYANVKVYNEDYDTNQARKAKQKDLDRESYLATKKVGHIRTVDGKTVWAYNTRR